MEEQHSKWVKKVLKLSIEIRNIWQCRSTTVTFGLFHFQCVTPVLGCSNFFTIKILKHWNRLPRELVAAPSLETFKVSLDGALSNMIKL